MKRVIFLMLISLLLVGFVSADTGQAPGSANNAPKVDLRVKYDINQGLYGYVDSTGNWVIEPNFEGANEFSEGVAAVSTRESEWKWGYIRPDGTFSIDCRFEGAWDFINGFAIVSKDGLTGTIDTSGNFILQPQYYLQAGTHMSKQIRAIVTDKNPANGLEIPQYGFITAEGKLIAPRFDSLPYVDGELLSFFIEDATKEVDKRRHFLLFPNGKEIEYQGEIMSVSEGVRLIRSAAVNERNRYSYVTEDGTVISEYVSSSGGSYPFVEARAFSEGVAAVAINNNTKKDSWGYINKDGTWLIEPTYESAGSFKDGLAPVKQRGMMVWGYINKDGSWGIEPDYMDESDIDPRFADIIQIPFYTKEEYDFTIREAEEICSRIVNDSMSDYEKLVKIYDYVIDNVEYDLGVFYFSDSPRAAYTAFSALKYGRTVCQGYAETVAIMLTIAGVENQMVIGYAGSLVNADPDAVNHGWNLVKINGSYYHVDATWDDKKVRKYTYFMVSDDFMAGARLWDRNKYPAAPKSYKK